MDKYNYLEAIKDDILRWLEDEGKTLTNYEDAEELAEELWDVDAVTGNGSGSYTFNTWEAEENLCHNMDLLAEAAEQFGYSVVDLKNGAEFWDVIIRCYLLDSACYELFNILKYEK